MENLIPVKLILIVNVVDFRLTCKPYRLMVFLMIPIKVQQKIKFKGIHFFLCSILLQASSNRSALFFGSSLNSTMTLLPAKFPPSVPIMCDIFTVGMTEDGVIFTFFVPATTSPLPPSLLRLQLTLAIRLSLTFPA